MPLKLQPPRPGKTPNYTIRGSYLGVRVDQSARTDKKPLAQKQLAKIERAIEAGEYGKPEAKPSKTFAEAALSYIESGHAPDYIGKLLDVVGTMPIDSIDQDVIEACAKSLYPNCAPITVNRRVHTPISAILKHAGIDTPIRRPKGSKGTGKTRFLMPEDAQAILAAAMTVDAEMGRLLAFLLYTGCRVGEAMALDWGNVHLDEGTAYISESKTGEHRSLLLRPELVSLLEPHRKAAGKVFRFRQGGYRNFLFLNAKVLAATGNRVPRPQRGKRLVVPPYRFDWVTFHSFRHTWATWMRRYGNADTRALIATGNWKDERSVRRYVHVAAHEEWQRVNDLPGVVGKHVDLGDKTRKK